MKLQNTQQYYRELAHYYFLQERGHLMGFFLGLANDNKYTHSDEDTNDWFKRSQIERPNLETFL